MSRIPLSQRFCRALSAFFSNEPPPPQSLAPADDRLAMFHPKLSQQAQSLPGAERDLIEWAENNRFHRPSLEGLCEWEALSSQRLDLASPSSELRLHLLDIDDRGAYFYSGHHLALEEIGTPNAQRWAAAYQAWTRITLANTASAFIDNLILGQRSSQSFNMLNVSLQAPGIDWSSLPPQSWLKLSTHLSCLFYSLTEAGQSEKDWEARGWGLEDIPAARQLLCELERADWPLERRFSEPEAQWLISQLRQSSMGSPSVDDLSSTPTLQEFLGAGWQARASFAKANAPLLRDEPIQIGLILERARLARERRCLESACSIASSPSHASRRL